MGGGSPLPVPLGGPAAGVFFSPLYKKNLPSKKGVVPIAKRGRPAATWTKKDVDMFKRMCSRFGTRDGIAAIFGISPKTLNKLINEHLHDEIKPDDDSPLTFEEAFAVYSEAGRQALREAQFEKALSGNSTMLIWLGKQYLGQNDNKDIAVSVEDDGSNEDEEAPLYDIALRFLNAKKPGRTGTEMPAED